MSNDINRKNDMFITVAVIENAIEAQLLASILTERNIPHYIRSHHDTAYDGLFQTQKGWGDIEAPIRYQTEIEKIIDHVRNADNA
ncbi:MAG: hypothetical protein HF978_05215 [Desulfobacteraceae bacterium]|nr:hypothetical protein [Desulfobacteraceae bacterium]MBC2754931.1 hypothetical protein [Desulfobacteraceae bacterium]